MTPNEIERACGYAEAIHWDDRDEVAVEPHQTSRYSEADDGSGCWVQGWLWVPAFAYRTEEVVPGGGHDVLDAGPGLRLLRQEQEEGEG